MNCLAKPTQRTARTRSTRASQRSGTLPAFEWNEVVWSGEFVADERLWLELWEAPAFPSRLVCETNLPGRKIQDIVSADDAALRLWSGAPFPNGPTELHKMPEIEDSV